MQKKWLVLVILVLLCSVPSFATSQTVSAPKLMVNGKTVTLTKPIVIKDGKYFLPAMTPITELGIKTEMLADKKTVKFTRETVVHSLASTLINQAAYYPLDVVAQKFGAVLLWDALRSTLQINDFNRMNRVESHVLKTELGMKGENESGWGPNIKKVARFGDMSYTFTFVFGGENMGSADQSYGRATLYEKRDGGEWQAGISFIASVSPNIMVDSTGKVNVVFFEPHNGFSKYAGKLTHLILSTPGTVKGEFEKSYLTNGNIEAGDVKVENYATIYTGASIAEDNTMLVAYNNSIYSDAVGGHTLGAQIYDPSTGKWTYETVAKDMTSRYCYPITAVSKDYYHILVIEDQLDLELAKLRNMQYRFGAVKHFQRKKTGGLWEETTLIDLNNRPEISLGEIDDAHLVIQDLVVDQQGLVHAILRYSGYYDGTRYQLTWNSRAYDFVKPENASAWIEKPICNREEILAAALWKSPTGKLFYVLMNRGGIFILPEGSTEKYMIYKAKGMEDGITDFRMFISNQNNSALKPNTLDLVFFPQNERAQETRTYSVKYEQNAFQLPYLIDIQQFEGRLLYANGNPAIMDAFVDIYTANDVYVSTVGVDGSGIFAVSGLKDGSYKFFPNSTYINGEKILASIMAKRYKAEAIAFQVKNRTASLTPITVKLKEPQFSLIVKDQSNNPLPNWQYGVFLNKKGFPTWSEHLLNSDAQLSGLEDGVYILQVKSWDDKIKSNSLTVTIKSGKIVGSSPLTLKLTVPK